MLLSILPTGGLFPRSSHSYKLRLQIVAVVLAVAVISTDLV